jgi:phosphopantetheinyl transferase
MFGRKIVNLQSNSVQPYLPLVYQHNINQNTKLGVWRIEEDEDFFLKKVPVSREITHKQKRLQHLAGRYILQVLFPSFPYHLIEIADTRKPFLPSEEYHFSISHCSNYAAAIVSSVDRVGVDIEIVSDRVFKIMHKFLNEAELEFVQKEAQNLTLLWCIKEAMFKWYGHGGVDFREHLHVMPFQPQTKGKVTAHLVKNEKVDLNLEYKITDSFVLAWTAS